jgi:hypothetical protein
MILMDIPCMNRLVSRYGLSNVEICSTDIISILMLSYG